ATMALADWLAQNLFPGDAVWGAEFRKRFTIVPGDTFNFLCETAMEVAPRVRIEEEKKTVARGALWYEEYLPAEAVLAGLVWSDRVYNGNAKPEDLLRTYCSKPKDLQIGGKATVGKGRVRCVFGE